MADDHAVMRAGLRALLSAERDIEVVGESEDGLDCMKKVKVLEPDVVLMDINMPHCNGLEALREIQAWAEGTRVLVLTMHDDAGYLREVLASGGSGYILKQAAADELLSAIRTVHEGGVFLHPHHARVLVEERSTNHQDAAGPIDGRQLKYGSLSDREAEVFRLVALGHRNSDIAELMFLSVKTVETYKSRLMKKLDIDTRAALVRLALELDLLT
jgi:DNA-binding NarL/FixJ family response regulator